MNVNERQTISIGELVRFCKRKGYKAGNVKWPSGANIDFAFDFINCLLVLSYIFQQTESVEERIRLVRIETNLKKGFQWYAICPTTGKKCRKLYLYGGRFVSRNAIPENYSTCNRSRKQRLFDKEFSILMLADKAKYRKEYYKGTLTPYGKKCEKAREGFRQVNPQFSNLL